MDDDQVEPTERNVDLTPAEQAAVERERALITQTDNSSRPEDGEQPDANQPEDLERPEDLAAAHDAVKLP